MKYSLLMGVPEMVQYFAFLAEGQNAGTLSKDEARFAKKFFKTLQHLSDDPRHNALQTHEIKPLSARFGHKVFQSYVENNTPAAGRLFWVYGPLPQHITVIGVEPHPEDRKHGAYDRIRLSRLPPIE